MASHRRIGNSSHRTMISEKKMTKTTTTTTTILLSLITMTVVGINDHVACWPMIESPIPWSTPSPSLPPPPPTSTSTSTSEELDSDTSRKVLGSSVVTSVSVVMNNSDGKSNSSTTPAVESIVTAANSTGSIATTTAITSAQGTVTVSPNKPSSLDDGSRMDNAELKSNVIASPGNFLNPDKYEFYTFDEAGDLVKRLMSWDEIQGLIAASDTDGLLGEAVVPMYYNENNNANANANAYIAVADKLHGTHLTADEFQTSDMQDVHRVVESVQNVLKSELAAAASSQSKIIPAAVKPSSLHPNSPNWSNLFLPNFLENLDDDAFVDLQQHHHHHLASDDTLTITSPIQYSSTFDKIANHTAANMSAATIGSLSAVPQTRTTTTPASASTTSMASVNNNNNSEKNVFATLSNDDVTIKNFATTPSAYKFTRIKNTAAKPTNFKHSSSTASEKVWSPSNLIVSDEKSTKNITHSSSFTSSLSSSLSTSTWSPSLFSSFSTYSHLPGSLTTSGPIKSHWSIKASPTSIASTVATPKTTTIALSNENSSAVHYDASVTTNHNLFTTALTNLLNQMSNDQQQSVKIRPSFEPFVQDSSQKTTTKHYYASHYGQHNASIPSNSNTVPLIDREKTTNASNHHSSFPSFKNSTENYSGGGASQMVTTPPALPYTRYNGHATHVAGDLATKTTDKYQHQHVYNDSTKNSSSLSALVTTAQSSPLYKQSPTSETTNMNTISWKSSGVNNGSMVALGTSMTSTPAKFNTFTPYRTATMAASTTTADKTTIRTTLSGTNNQLGQQNTMLLVKIHGDGQSTTSTTTAEPLVTWISTNNFDDRIENKISNKGQILESDKLVTEQYVSGTAPAAVVTTNEQLVSFSKDINRINSGGNSGSLFGNDTNIKTNVYSDGKKHTTQTVATGTSATTIAMSQQSLSSSYHTWMSATTSEPTPDLIQQKLIPNPMNNNGNSNHQAQSQPHPQLQHVFPNRNSVATSNSYYHRDRPGATSSAIASSSTNTDTILKYTKNPVPSSINTTVANEMVMQRIPTLDPPNKVTSTANGGIAYETNEKGALIPPNQPNVLWPTKSELHHSSTESVKNLTQIAVMVNKSNDTQVTMTKNSFNKNTAELKHKQTAKPSYFFDLTNSNNNPNKKYNANNSNSSGEEDKTQPTVKPLNGEFLNDCITSFISNSMVSGSTSGSGSNNHEREALQSSSYNSNVGSTANASRDNQHYYNHHHHHHHHHHHNHGENNSNDKDENNYHSTPNVFSRDQNKHNSSLGANVAGTVFETTYHTATTANTWDTFQKKVTLPTLNTTMGEKQKENSHIYYYKLPPINSQPLKANSNTPAVYSVASSTVGRNTYSSTAATTTSWTTSRTTSTSGTDKTYQKITTVNRPMSSSLPSNLVTNELMDMDRNTWKQNAVIGSLTNLQHSLHTEARISSSSSSIGGNTIDKTSTIPIQDTTHTWTDSSTNLELENREVSAATAHQIGDTKLSQFTPTKHDYNDDNNLNSSYLANQDMKLKSSTGNWNSSSTKHTEPITTPQLITVTLNFSTASDATIQQTTPVIVGELSDLRKEYILQYNDVNVAIANDNNDDDDDDDDDDAAADDDDDDDDVNDDQDDNEHSVENDNVKQINHENDHRHKVEEDMLGTKNQRVANVTAAQFWPVRRKTTLDESASKDQTQNNVTNKNFTSSNPERQEIRTTSLPTSSPLPQKNVTVLSSTTPRFGDVNGSSNIVTFAATRTTTTTFGNISNNTAGLTTITSTSAAGSISSTVTAHNDIGFVRVKLENRTTQSLNETVATPAPNNKQKDDKPKITLAKNQPSKQNTISGSTITTMTTNSLPQVTNPAHNFRSPVTMTTLSRPPLFTTGGVSSTVSPIVVAAPTTVTWTTNGNGNTASAAVELHPAPHENMGLEASIAYLGDDVKTFIDLCNELSFKIWTTQTGKSLTTSRSIVLSPFALLSTLAMIFLGARGSSSGIMNDFLRLDDMVTFNPHQVFRNITESAMNSKNSGAANVAFVRQVFSDKTKGNVLDFYKERLQQYYDTYVEEINFNTIGDLVRRRTNLLVKRQTQGRIQDYLRGSAITMKPPLATFTANIFQTDCSAASTEGRDGEMYFVVRPSTRQRRLVPIPAVVYRGGFLAGYEPGLDATAVTLSPESIISTILVLPGQQGQVAPGDGLARLEQRLLESSYRRGAWSRLLRSLLFRHGLEVQIPRFSHKSILNLTMGLQRMGMGEIFAAEKADLRGINGLLNELHLSDCIQANTFSTCGEESVGARHHVETFPSFAQRTAAGRQVDPKQAFANTTPSTPLSASKSEPPLHSRPRQARLPDNPRLRFDRPFLYIVRHNPTELPASRLTPVPASTLQSPTRGKFSLQLLSSEHYTYTSPSTSLISWEEKILSN